VTATTSPIGDETPVPRASTQRIGSIALVIGVTALVGFLLIGQLRGTEAFRQRLESENEGDLTRILAGLTTEADALQAELSNLKVQLLQLQNNQASSSASNAAAEAQLRSWRVLAGTVPVTGPGLTIRIDDPEASLAYDTIIDVVAELRDAGAEALSVNGRRIGASTSFGERDGRISVDDIAIEAPYRVAAIGDPANLEGGLRIPGGAIDVLSSLRGVVVDLRRAAKIDIPALTNPPKFRTGKPQTNE
jgi:uncharacterized protein YlxW (UPF0749 family)